MMLPRGIAAACLFASPMIASPVLAADYGLAGPHEVILVQLDEPEGIRGALAFPADVAEATPVVLLAHGFASSSQRMFGWGQHLASHGFIALAFDNCVGEPLCGPDPAAQPDHVVRALGYLESDRAPSAVRSKAATGRFLLLRHSAGGQAMAVAANELRPRGLLLFDPVAGDQAPESTEPARAALATTCAATLTLFAEPHAPDAATGTPSCNKIGGFRALVSAGPRASAIVTGSTHCDGELPARIACGYACGGRADEARQVVYKRYAAAFSLALLRDDRAAAEALTDGLLTDPALREAQVVDGTSCEGLGWPALPGRGGGGGAAGSSTTGAAPPPAPGSDGCALVPSASGTVPAPAPLALLALCIAARRFWPRRTAG